MSGCESPFKGLESFEDSDHDARLFFGREREREIIVANLLASKLTVLYGDTGVGKSSVLRAGVARDLRALPDPLAVVVFDQWKDDPAGTVQERVAAATGAERQSRLVDTLELGAAIMGGEVVVILDGFEEEFLYHGSDGGPDSFFDQFSEAVTKPGLRASFLVAVREDALAKLDRFKSRVPNVFGNYLRLPHLDRDAGREAILGPVDRYNETADTPVEVEPGLVEAVLDQVAAGKVELGQAGRGAVDADSSQAGIEAPYLQLVMERLWEAEKQGASNVLRLETFERLGGAEQIVRDHLDRALHALGPEQRDVAAAVFNHLVTPSGAKIAHDASDLAGYVGVAEADVAPVLSALASQRILRSVPGVRGSDQPRYEIYHDILADPVLAWRTRHDSERELARVREAGAKRHRRLLFVAAGAVILAGAMAVVTIVFVTLRSEADAQAARAKAQAYDGWALSEIESDPELSLALAAQAATLETTDRVQDVLRKTIIASRVRRVYRTNGPVAAAQFSPDGSQVLVAGGTNGHVYERGSRQPRLTISHGARIVAAGFSPDGKVIFTAGMDGAVRLWSAADGHRLAVMLRNGPAIRTVSFDRKGERIAAAGKRIVHVWRVRDGRPVFAQRFPWPVTRVKLSPDGKLLAVIGNHPSVVVYRLRGGEPVSGFAQERPIKGNILKDVAFSPDGTLLASGGREGGVLVWDVRTGKLLRPLPHNTEVLALAFSRDGKILATAGADGVGRIWNARNGRLRVALIGHTHYVVGIGFSPDSKYVVTASRDGTARVWDVGGDLLALLAGDSDTVTAASFSSGRARPLQVLTASDDGSARLWDPQTQPRLRRLTKEPGALLRAFSVGHGLLLVAGPGREARLLRAADGHLVRHFRAGGRVVAAAVSKDGRFVAVGAGRTAAVFDRKSGRRVDQIRQPSSVEAISLSPSGDLLGTGGLDGIGRIWKRGSRQPSQFLRGHSAAITAIAFSPDREHVATGSADATTRIWDLGTGSSRTLKRNQDSNPITSVSFSPDRHGSWLLTSSKGTDVVLWHVETGTQQQLFRWHFGAVSDASFSPDGRWIVTVGPTTLQLWRPSDRAPLFRLGIAGPGGMTGATFDSSSRRIFAVAKDGQVLTYRCEVCGRLDELLPLARAQLRRTGRKLSGEEQKKFAG